MAWENPGLVIAVTTPYPDAVRPAIHAFARRLRELYREKKSPLRLLCYAPATNEGERQRAELETLARQGRVLPVGDSGLSRSEGSGFSSAIQYHPFRRGLVIDAEHTRRPEDLIVVDENAPGHYLVQVHVPQRDAPFRSRHVFSGDLPVSSLFPLAHVVDGRLVAAEIRQAVLLPPEPLRAQIASQLIRDLVERPAEVTLSPPLSQQLTAAHTVACLLKGDDPLRTVLPSMEVVSRIMRLGAAAMARGLAGTGLPVLATRDQPQSADLLPAIRRAIPECSYDDFWGLRLGTLLLRLTRENRTDLVREIESCLAAAVPTAQIITEETAGSLLVPYKRGWARLNNEQISSYLCGEPKYSLEFLARRAQESSAKGHAKVLDRRALLRYAGSNQLLSGQVFDIDADGQLLLQAAGGTPLPRLLTRREGPVLQFLPRNGEPLPAIGAVLPVRVVTFDPYRLRLGVTRV